LINNWVKGIDSRFVTTDLDTLLVALYVFVEDLWYRPAAETRPAKRLSDGQACCIFPAAAVVTAKRPVLHGEVIWRYQAS